MFGKRLYLFFAFLFFTQLTQAQLSNFNLNVTKTDATCPSNGTLNFSVSNTTAGSTILYSIFLLPSTTPISVQSATSISGLAPGNYRVVATQSLGSDSGSQQQNITIGNSIVPLTYQVSSTREVCGNDGTITVNITGGTAVKYEIFSGPMTRPLQTTNMFTGLMAGVYQIRVFDNCNQGVVQTYTLQSANTNLNFSLFTPSLASCNTVTIGSSFQSVVPTPVGIIKYPIQITTTLFPPSGPSITYNQTINSGIAFSQIVPLFPNQTYNYSFTITDGCGTVYTLNGIIQNLAVGPASYTVAPQDCTHKLVAFSSVSAINLISAPAGYGGAVPNNFTPSIVNNSVTINNLTAGTYVFSATDLCGNTQQYTVVIVIDQTGTPPFHTLFNVTCVDATLFIYEITQLTLISCPATYAVTLPHDYTSLINTANYAVFVHLPVGTYVFNVLDRCGSPRSMTIVITPVSQGPTASVLEGCETGVGSVQIAGQLLSISLISAPSAYGGSLPLNLTGNVTTNGTRLSLDSLPPGTYVFQSTNSCGQSFTTNATVIGYQENTVAAIIANCGSFNFNLQHTSNNSTSSGYWLQKYNTSNNTWGHPLTNAVYIDGTTPTATNSFQLNNNAINYNLAYAGHFRVLKIYTGYIAGSPTAVNCFKVIYEFDFSGDPKINDIYSISCGSTFEVVVDAVGNSALTYRIITKNGQPFIVQNGSSSLFSGLEPAIYVFEVEDVCHNTINGQFQVLNPNPMQISANTITCNGQSLTLTVPNFAFLTYQWWKGNNTATILSTTNSFNIASFNSATNNGIYHVRILYTGNPNSCLNQVLDYTININNTIPHAGNDNTASYCGRQGIVDLSTLLTGTFDTTGIWSETTSSGMLTNSSWDSTNVPFGTYQFKYTVSGSCSTVDEASINIAIKEIPDVPTASVDPTICETEDLNLFATTVTNATYQWTGPNGFVSSIQNPTINSVSTNSNGIYIVHSALNGCLSGDSTVEVLVNPVPDFVLNQDCVDKQYQVWVTKLNPISFNEANSNFSWTGPNNFTSNQNAITITNAETGTYALTITNENGCAATKSIEVFRTNCFIPNVITPNNDQENERFDLTGFDVAKLEIYNRWGTKVYEKNNYIDEWHGQSTNGGNLPDSTYYYVIKLDTEEIKTGWIFLSRG